MKRSLPTFIGTIVLVAGLAGSSADASPPEERRSGNHAATLDRRSVPGALPGNPVAYARRKAALNARVRQAWGRVSTVPRTAAAPIAPISWEGVLDPDLTPPDSTGAIGTTRYIELVNQVYAIYDRFGGPPPTITGTGALQAFAGAPAADFVFDPQVIWDPGTDRFYYLMSDFTAAGANMIAWGFSKTNTPSRSKDFCHYFSSFGYFAPQFGDYPKLGDTQDFILAGVNVFAPAYTQSDVLWVSKPPAGPITDCPSIRTFKIGKCQQLKNPDGTLLFTPVPAVQTDDSPTGYVVGTQDLSSVGFSNYVTVYTVTKVPLTGKAQCRRRGRVFVHTFGIPADAPQTGTPNLLDTLDGRLEHAVSAVDPLVGGVTIWTAHAVLGGAGSEERWYEINPAALTLAQPQGAATNGSLFVWNGAISPDRGAGMFGQSMVMGFNTSSVVTLPDIQMVSKIGAGAQSGFVPVKGSVGPDMDFTCTPVCRWGDYSGATPDPLPMGATGQVWLSNQWLAPPVGSTPQWRTWNWEAEP